MRIGLVVNVVDSNRPTALNFRLAAECVSAGHEVWVTSGGELACHTDTSVGALARAVPPGRYTAASFLRTLKSDRAIEEWVKVDALDVLLLRTVPFYQRPWAKSAGIEFGRLAMRHGVIVLNDPNGLAKATNKLYLQTFPAEARPRTLITRNHDRIAEFVRDEGTAILKPLQGSGGAAVFLARREDLPNLREIVEAISRDGYVVAQEYLPAADQGDTRLFLMNGVPLRHKGKYAVFSRLRNGDDIRSNVHAGGKIRPVAVSDTMLRLAEMVRPRLVEDGMFLAGLDIVGDKITEINVFAPGGLGNAQRLQGTPFIRTVVEALERKVDYMRYYRRNFCNQELATL